MRLRAVTTPMVPPQADTEHVRHLTESLRHELPETRCRAALALADAGAAAHTAAAPLAALIKDPDRAVRCAAMLALFHIGAVPDAVVPSLSESLTDEDAGVRFSATLALARVERLPPEPLPALARAVGGDPSPHVRYASAVALGGTESDREAAVSALVNGLEDDDPSVTIAAAAALGRIGPAAEAALPALLQAASSRNPMRWLPAVLALSKVSPGSIQPSRQTLDQVRDVVAFLLRQALAKNLAWFFSIDPLCGIIGEAGQAFPLLREAIGYADPSTSATALVGLSVMGPAARDGLPNVFPAFRHTHPLVRGTAAFAFKRVVDRGTPDSHLIGALVPEMYQPEPRPERITRVLWESDYAQKVLLPRLLGRLRRRGDRREDYDDQSHDLYLRFHRRVSADPTLGGIAPRDLDGFLPFLQEVLRGYALNNYNRPRRRKRQMLNPSALDEGGDFFDQLPARLEPSAETEDFLGAVRDLVSRSLGQEGLLVLNGRLDGWTYEEIARVIGASPTRVDTILRKIRKVLADWLPAGIVPGAAGGTPPHPPA
jgi:RNA polymerase sigma factor (sigma-70 family)